ncbi:MAG: hypothetical protein ABJA86_07795 [Nocardioidaceae bacterium]
MHISWKGALATVAASAMLVVGVDYATFAANGDSLILGHLNAANDTTVLTKHGPGPALRLNSAGPGSPALAVDSKAKVAKLNADMVDGKHANALLQAKNVGRVYTTAAAGGTGQVIFDVPDVPNGIYLATYTANFFPQGTPGAPIPFSCFLLRDGIMSTQSTSSSAAASGFYIGVNGSTVVKAVSGTDLTAGCGLTSGAWTFGTKKLTVTLTRLDGVTAGGLPTARGVKPGRQTAAH